MVGLDNDKKLELFRRWVQGDFIYKICRDFDVSINEFDNVITNIMQEKSSVLKRVYNNMLYDYSKLGNYNLISKKYGLPANVCSKMIKVLDANDEKIAKKMDDYKDRETKVSKIIKDSVTIRKNNIQTYLQQLKEGGAILVTEAYRCGYCYSYMEKNFEISDTVNYLCTTEGIINQNKITDLKEIYVYQNLLAHAYDENIITNDMLNNLFQLDKKQADCLKVPFNNSIESFTSNKLYQIYYTPSLLYNFTFTDSSIEKRAMEFIDRRYNEELMEIFNNFKSYAKIKKLSELYYGTKSGKYIERVKQI